LAIYVLAFGYGMTEQGQWNKRHTVPFCETKQRLIGDFTTANHELIELQNQQTQAVIDHESDFTRFDEPIHMAREKKDKAKYVLMAHTSEHHC
jgi:hypothetical protein